MHTPLVTETPPQDQTAFAAELATLRASIDGFDTQILELLHQRTRIVEQVATLKQQQGLQVFMKPGREAVIVRRLLAQNQGHLPPRLVIQLWREIMMASLQLEQPFRVAAVGLAGWSLARDHFGCLTPLVPAQSVVDALEQLDKGSVLMAVIPDPVTDWWPLLLHCQKPVRFVFRLPDTGQGSGWSIGPVPLEESGDDVTMIAIENNILNENIDILMKKNGLTVHEFWTSKAAVLLALQGFIPDHDPRLQGLPVLRHLGCHAVPVP